MNNTTTNKRLRKVFFYFHSYGFAESTPITKLFCRILPVPAQKLSFLNRFIKYFVLSEIEFTA